MIKSFSSRFLFVSLFFATLLFSCQAGLGLKVDLEPPELLITNHANMDYVTQDFDLAGTCYDNVAVDRVIVEDVESGEVLGNAVITDDSWSISLSLEEGERNLRATAYDKFGNSSFLSVAQITLLIDASAPLVNNLEIIRHEGIYSYLDELDNLKALSSASFYNIDSFQNESFILKAEIQDNFPLSSVSLGLWDEAGNWVLSLDKTPESSLDTPQWEINQAVLTAANPDYRSGIHYFRVSIRANDSSGNSTEMIDQSLWFCWYPESDYPQFNSDIFVNSAISVPKDNTIPLSFFDDDNLLSAHARLLTPAEYAAISGGTESKKIQSLIDNPNKSALLGTNLLSSMERNLTYTLNAGSTAGQFYLAVLLEDSKVGESGLWRGFFNRVLVTDEDAPILVIDSPNENTFPSLSGGDSFTIDGYTLDNLSTESLYMAWIPQGVPGGTDGAIDQLIANTSSLNIPAGNKVTQDGVVIWSLNLGGDITQSINGKDYVKNSFSLTLDILDDFKINGTLENDSKVLLFLAIDNDGNEINRTFRLLGNHNGPVISSPLSDMKVHDKNQDLELDFSATHSSGLAITSYSLKDYSDPAHPVDISLTENGGVYSALISSSDISVERGIYRFRAVDALGNDSELQRTVVFSVLPVLEKITSGMLNTTYKAGDLIELQAVFSSSVTVTGTPLLQLCYDNSNTPDITADYSLGSGTDTLVFKFSVPADIHSSKLYSLPTAIDLNGGLIDTTEGSGGAAILPDLSDANSLQGLKSIGLDGSSPEILSLGGSGGSYMAGEDIEIALTLTEPVLVNGSPDLLLICDDSSTIQAEFTRISGSTLYFVYSIGSSIIANPLTYNFSSCFSASDLALITDVAGNPLSLGTDSPQDTAFFIDTHAPAAPVLSLTSGFYDSAQQLTLNSLESGASYYYSLNGGVTWTAYSGPVPLGEGTYTITAYQKDAAGNRSVNSVSAAVDIDINFPSISSVACNEPDGIYPAGESLNFKVFFSSTVKTINGNAKITLGDGTNVSVDQNPTGATYLLFPLTIPVGMSLDPVIITDIDLDGVVDPYGNSGTAVSVSGSSDELGRSGLIIDSIRPVISTYLPAIAGVFASGGTDIVLTFSENVIAESGMITLQPYGNWLLPPVLTEDEFSAIFYSSAMSAVDRSNLMETDANGSALLDSQTGLPVGPYIKTTQGLVLDGSEYLPDRDTKYVLDFEKDLDDPLIKAAFTTAGYLKQTIDVTSYRVSISGNVATITLPESLPDGREWEILIDEGAFRDSAGNIAAAVTAGTYHFWSDKVATPVIRVDRYTHGWGASEPNDDATVFTTVGPADSTTQPTGYVRARIDCETPGANISFAVENTSISAIDFTNDTANQSSANGDLQLLNVPATSTSYTSYLVLGDGRMDTARKDYIIASASRTGLTASDIGLEGVFKSLVYYRNPQTYTSPIRFQGSNIEGGMPTISGFPMRDADPDIRFSKYAAKLSTEVDDWVLISYEIISNWAAQSVRNNWQQGYRNCSYGNFTYVFEQYYW